MKRVIKHICVYMCIVLVLSIFTPIYATEQNTTLSE